MVYEDFTTYTEVDNDNCISKTANQIIHCACRDGKDAYVYNDKSVGHFTNFTHLIDFKGTNVDCASKGLDNADSATWCVTQDVGALNDLQAASKNFLCVRPLRGSDKKLYLYITECNAGTIYLASYATALTDGIYYYLKVVKNVLNFHVDVYPTAADRTAGTNKITTVSLTLHADRAYQYIFGCNGWYAATSKNMQNYINNLDLQEGGVTYYKTITEYLGGLDSKSRLAVLHKTITDLIGGLDTKSRIASLHRTFTDKIGGLDSISRIRNYIRLFIDKIGGLDSITHILSAVGHLYRTIIESLGALDTKSKIKTLYRTFTDKLSSLDTKIRKVSLHRIFTDKLGLKDTRSRIAVLHRIFTEKLGGLDTFLHEKQKQLFRVIVEFIGTKDTFIRTVSLHRIMEEIIGMKDKGYRLWNWFRKHFKYKDKEHPRQQINKTGD